MALLRRTTVVSALVALVAVASLARQRLADASQPTRIAPSSVTLNRLPDGETKRKFILDCTGCHQIDETIARANGNPRSAIEWEIAVTRMLGFSGATSGFPVMAADREPRATGEWLARSLGSDPIRRQAAPTSTIDATVEEFMMPEERDLPHDVAVARSGHVVVTGMLTHTMYELNPDLGLFTTVPIPLDRSNPRAVELDSAGNWWVALGGPRSIARYDIAAKTWATYSIGVYPHSVALAPDGRAWANGHFTRDPELAIAVDHASRRITVESLPPHPTMARVDGGPIPYEIRVADDGVVWVSELGGNRLVSFNPRTREKRAFEMPVSHSGPRRFDIAPGGILWIPLYAAGEIVRLDPNALGPQQVKRYPLPMKDALPYVVKFDRGTGMLWVGTGAADALLRFDPRTEKFGVIALPAAGAMVRHLAIDPRNHDIWAAYGASPGIAARIARIRVK